MPISPDMVGGETGIIIEPAGMVASTRPPADAMDPHERILGDALSGDAPLFAREDYVAEARRIVDPLLGNATRLHSVSRGHWARWQWSDWRRREDGAIR